MQIFRAVKTTPARAARHPSFWRLLALALLWPLSAVPAAFDPALQSAGAVVLVNSHSARYLDFQRLVQPYLDNFGVPYSVLDLSTNSAGASISNCAVLIIGHSQIDTNLNYLNPAAQSNLSLAISSGTGLINFDSDLSSNGVPRYQFIQAIFGFGYSNGVTNSAVTLPATEPGPLMHFVTARHPTNDTVPLRSSLAIPGTSVPANTKVLARLGSQPLVAVASYGQGRALQWRSYDWMASNVLGPVGGLDDLVWRGVVWAARKPFAVRGMPNFVTMRVDDVEGGFDWVRGANAVGFKPFLALFYSAISSANINDLRNLVTNGNATASIHSISAATFFYFNHPAGTANSDLVQSNNFYNGTRWHTNNGIPISKICATHYSEIGANCFAGLKAWGMEYVPIEVVPGTVEYTTPGAPWLVGGPYRLYETPKPGQTNLPTYYADWLSVPGHPEFDGQFFNIYSEVRDVSSCAEWCPDNDVAATTTRATAMLKRSLDSQVLATLFTHEWFIHPTSCCGSTTISSNNWRLILQGITNNLAAYQPSFVTLDYASQYVRATRTSRLVSCAFDPGTGLVTGSFAGKADLPLQVSVFVGADSAITNSVATLPLFTAGLTNTLAAFAGRPTPPAIVTDPASVTTNAGASIVLSVSAIGTAPLSYQWMKNNSDLTNSIHINGATTSALTLTAIDSTDSGAYSVVITNDTAGITSSPATVTVVFPPQFTSAAYSNGSVLSLSLISNVTYRIDVSSNLVYWDLLTNIVGTDGPSIVLDSQATNQAERFYRAAWVP